MMEKYCPTIERCPLFNGADPRLKDAFAGAYCLCAYWECQRFQLRQKGEPVPRNLMPHGGVWKQKPPEFA
jgi:hypothetical protein